MNWRHNRQNIINDIRLLHDIARDRGQMLAQMVIAWLLKDQRVTSVLIGVSKLSQLDDCLGALANKSWTDQDLIRIEEVLKEY